ncbi:hypothetical protein ACLBYG_22195 [Methylobacterium sp. D53M]
MVGLSLGRIGTYAGIRLVADPHMVDVVEDWSRVRSPSRAARRRRQGHRQRIRYLEVPKADIIHLPAEGVMVAHPATIDKLYARIAVGMDRRREAQAVDTLLGRPVQ